MLSMSETSRKERFTWRIRAGGGNPRAVKRLLNFS